MTADVLVQYRVRFKDPKTLQWVYVRHVDSPAHRVFNDRSEAEELARRLGEAGYKTSITETSTYGD